MALTSPHRPAGDRLGSRLLLALVSLCLLLAALEAALRAGGAAMKFLHERENSLALRRKGSYRIMCLGESTTWDEYPRLLERTLNSGTTGMRFSVIDKGVPGGNTSDLLAELAPGIEEYHPDMVVAMMGVNDLGIRYDQEILDPKSAWYEHVRTYRWARLWWLYASHGLRRPQAADKFTGSKVPPERGSDPGTFHQSQGQPPPRPPRPPASDDLVLLPPGPDADRIQEALAAMGQHDQARAERLLRQALAANPANDVACNELGVIYMAQRKLPQAIKAFQRAVRLGARHLSGSGDASSSLGRIYQEQGLWEQAEAMFRNAIELKPRSDKARFELAEFYREQGRLSEALRCYKETLELDPGSDSACAALSLLYARLGDAAQARLYERKTAGLRSRVNPMTAGNYRRLKERLDAKGILLVCVQYPMMSVSPLRRIFAGDADEPLFVDNEAVFREAVRRGSSAEYFRDLFGGDFGHCTRKGNRLLADNIAQAILRRYFRR